MKNIAAAALATSLAASGPAFAQQTETNNRADAVRAVSPALLKYNDERLLGEVWETSWPLLPRQKHHHRLHFNRPQPNH